MPPRNQNQLARELTALGLRRGDCVMMHSSLSALGPVDGGAETVVDALRDAIGSEGTLIVPAFRDNVWADGENFTNSDCDCDSADGLCHSQQPGFQGVIAEAVRRRRGSLRSCHPTHSWIALGLAARDLLIGHRQSPTMCGPGNPLEELVRRNGCLLLLGVQVNTVTLWHYYEERLRVPYLGHYWPKQRHHNHCVPGRRIYYEFPGIMQDVCRSAGILSTGPVGKSTSGLMRAADFERFLATVMADDPYCMVLRPPQRDSGDLAIDALQKAARMLEAWNREPRQPDHALDTPLRRIEPLTDNDVVREDCPAFAGYHNADGRQLPLCRANDRHPDYFRQGGVFNQCGLATCPDCSWHRSFPRA
jgi:aminoglycoside N3'-acetyltransferase